MHTPAEGSDAGPDALRAGSISTEARSAAEVPRRSEGVQLIGEMAGSGYRVPPALARRGDGQVVQLTPLLYSVLAASDGRRTYAQIADVVSQTTGSSVTEDNVRTLIDSKLQHTGLLANPDGSQPELKKAQPLLGLRFKLAVTDPDRTRRLTRPFAALFNPVVVVAVLSAFAVLSWWLLLVKGLASATHEAFDRPGLLALIVLITILSAGFHEFGHAAAARRGGATPGVMGAGIYLVWPAFYTDVTDSYRLGRGGRLRTDLGGLYFNAIVAIVVTGAAWSTGYDALLLIVAMQILQMIRQLTPLVRFDGYHVLADVTGVPDLFHRIRPTLLGLLPWRWSAADATVLKPWARAVVSVWVITVVPLLLFSLFTIVISLPRVLATAWAGLTRQQSLMSSAFGEGDVLGGSGRLLAMIALVFPLLAVLLILVRLVKQVGGATWRTTSGRPVRRSVALVMGAALVAGLCFAWLPRGDNYRPVMAYERGTLADAVHALPLGNSSSSTLSTGARGDLITAWPDAGDRPTREHPQLALILIPREQPSSGHAEPWVFPFAEPLKPGPGDNQAVAVNTVDDTIRYDVAFALVWVTGDAPALQKNESYALASCSNCAAVSIAFQVVLVSGENHVAAPQNIAVAVNHDCVNCLTYALATQLFVTLDGPLSDAGMQKISALWDEIAAFGAGIEEIPLSEIQDRLTGFEQQILDITEQDPAGDDPEPSPTPTSTASRGGVTPAPDDPSRGPGEPTPEATTSDPSRPATPSAPAPTAEPAATPTPAKPTG